MPNFDHFESEIPLYKKHDGTVVISGSTSPRKAGKCALHFLGQQKSQIDFLCIGANANQQAMKAMGVFLYMVEHDNGFRISVAFQPLRFMTVTESDSPIRGEDPILKRKDCTVWRTVVLDRSNTENDTETGTSPASSEV